MPRNSGYSSKNVPTFGLKPPLRLKSPIDAAVVEPMSEPIPKKVKRTPLLRIPPGVGRRMLREIMEINRQIVERDAAVESDGEEAAEGLAHAHTGGEIARAADPGAGGDSHPKIYEQCPYRSLADGPRTPTVAHQIVGSISPERAQTALRTMH